jgi:two-component sensor histidine kinase
MGVTIPTDVARGLGDEGRSLLRRVMANMNLLADLIHADVLLFARAGSRVQIISHAQPEPAPSVYPRPLAGRSLKPEQIAPVARLLQQESARHQVQGAVVNGIPIIREVFPIRDSAREVVASLVTETAIIEHDRQQKRNDVFKRALLRVRDLVVRGRMQGGENVGRLGVHDGIMVIDAHGVIRYVTVVAEGLYRLLGYTDSLVNSQLSELDTNEYVAFRAMETGTCLEQRVTEHDQIWIKRVVPLVPTEPEGWLERLPGRGRPMTGAIVIIQDVTDELRKEQELRVKSAMIQEIHHRVKNNLQTIAALVRLQARRTDSPAVAEVLKQTVNRIISVAVVHEFLSKDELSVINIHEVSNRILQEVTHGTLDPNKRISMTLEGAKQFLLPAQQATSCALIINELLQNAVEHGYADRDTGQITVRLLQTDDSMAVEIEDDGRGLPEGFDPRQGGLGLKIVRTLVKEDLKGQFQIENGVGVRAVVSFPRWPATAGGAGPKPVAPAEQTGGGPS